MLKKCCTIALLVLLVIGSTGCGGGGSSPAPEPPSPPPSSSNPTLQVSPSSINQTVELGGDENTSTITLSNSDDEGNAYTITTNVDWISISSTSGTVPAEGSTAITLTFSCTEETSLSGSVTVEGSNGNNDTTTLSVSLTCEAPPLIINIASEPAETRVLTGEAATASLNWSFSSTWSEQGSEGYTITTDNSAISISNLSGVAEPGVVVEHDLEFSCDTTGRESGTLTITIDDDNSTDLKWDIACLLPEQDSIWIRMYQGVLVVEITANTNDAGEVDYSVYQSARLLEDRVTYVSVVVTHAGLVPLPIEIAVLGDTETILDDEVEVIATPPGEDEAGLWTTEFVYNMPIEHVERDISFEVRIDPDDLFPEEHENNNTHVVNYEVLGITVADERYRSLEILVLPIIGEYPAPEGISENVIYDVMKDLLPVTEYTIAVGETIDMSEEEWDIDEALSEVAQKRLEDQDQTRHYHGLFVYDQGVSGPCGLAYVGGWSGVSAVTSPYCRANTFAHEIGHNLNLLHAPGCEAGNPDTGFPYDGGGIGDEFGWLIDSRQYITNGTTTYYDFMGYCSDGYVAQYHYARALTFWQRRSIAISTTPLAAEVVYAASGFKQDESLILMGALEDDGPWSLKTVKHLPKPPIVVAPIVSPFTIKLESSTSGRVLYSELLLVNEIDHSTNRHWSAVVPVPAVDKVRIVVVDRDGNTLFAEDLNWLPAQE